MHHYLVLVLFVLVFEVAPLRQDLHGLNILDCRQLLPVVFVAAEGIQVNLLSKAFIFMLDHFEDVVDLLAVKHLLIIHASDRMEDSPHYLRVVDSTKVVSNIETKDNFVELGFFNSDSLVSQRRWQLAQEVRQSNCSHVKLSHWVVFGPSVLEGLDVFLLESEDVIFILRLLVIVETFTDNSDEDIHKNEERHQLKRCPKEDSD